MKQKITSTALMLFFAGIVCGQMSGLKSSENLYSYGDLLTNNVLYENFETWPPAGWTFIGRNWSHPETGTLLFLETWEARGVITRPGGGKFVAMVFGYYPYDTCWMITPSMIISKGDNLSFWMCSMPGGPQHLEILVSQTDNSINSFKECIGAYSYDDYQDNPWKKYKLDLSQYEGKTIYIAWKFKLQFGWFYTMIDMVRVGPALISDAALLLNEPPDYVPAGELVISGTILNQGSDSITQADVSWQVDDGPIYTERFQGFSVAEDSGYNFFCHDKYVTSQGNHTLKVKIVQVNGLGSDQNSSNDSINCSFYVCSNSAPRMHLFELFTSSSCGGCSYLNNDVIEPSARKYNGKVAVVEYKTDYDIPETGIRGEYYGGLGWVPFFFVDGITSNWLTDSYPKEVILGYIDSLFMLSNEQRAVAEIKSRHTVFQSIKNIEINATITPYFSGTGYKTYICVVEKRTTGNSDGESEFSVLMKMLPDAHGISMNFVDGIPQNINLSASLSDKYIKDFSDLAVVLFIQDTTTKKVIQAAYSEDTTTETSDANLTIFHKGIDVTNKEVSVEGNATDDEIIAYLKINNPSDKQVQVKVRKIENSVVPGSENSFCLGVCYSPAVSESILPYTISAGESIKDSVFYVIYCPRGNPGQSVIKYEVFDMYNPEINKVSVTVNFIGSQETTTDTSDATLTISHNGIDVTNKEVSVEGNATDDEIIAYLRINNPSDKQVQVKVRKIENSVVPGSENSFCLGVCYTPTVSESILPYTISAGESIKDSVFYVIYCPRGNPGQSVIKYEVFDTYNSEINKVSVTVNFIGSPPSGIDKYITAKETLIVYPNPCSLDQVTIRLHESGTVHFNKIILTNSSGIVLNSLSITDHTDNFLVDVHDYPNGIYYLFLSIEGGPLRMEKIIINR